jgi:hypothetical protein
MRPLAEWTEELDSVPDVDKTLKMLQKQGQIRQSVLIDQVTEQELAWYNYTKARRRKNYRLHW